MNWADVIEGSALLLATTAFVALVLKSARASARASRSVGVSGQLQELIPDALFRLDDELRIEDLNQKAADLLEQPREALLRRSILAFLDREYLPEVVPGATLEARREFDLTLPSGRSIRIQSTLRPLVSSHGRPFGSLLQLRSLSGDDRQEIYQRRAAAVFEHTAEGVMILDREGRLEQVNPAYSRITGFSPEEVVGRTPAFLRYGQIWAELISAGHWQGEIINHRRNGDSYPEWLTISAIHASDGGLQSYVCMFSDVSHLKKSEAELKHMAHYDALTDLPNRTLMSIQLNMALERAARRGNKLAVFALDLDGFKTVNDSLGHPAGDLLLQKIAARLRSTLRSEDVVARMGGDEFAMIIENPPTAIHLGHLADKIIAAVARPVDLQGNSAMVTASIGVAIYPQDGDNATTLLKAADTAMYASKQAGRNTYRYHDDDMAAAANQRLAMEVGLRRALAEDQLELCYQPQVDVATGEVFGVEALLRWNHPERGRITPSEFIPVAEETGLIQSIGEWVLRTACSQVLAWQKSGLFNGSLAVNVAGPQIERGNFANTVERVLDETRFDAKHLVLEITESVLLRNARQAVSELGQLRRLGVSIAIDDFGIGYSSLSYLKYLSAQGIKIDQRFVVGLPGDKNDAAITRAIIAMGRSLGFDMIAEGVETAAQRDFLEHEGCQLMQGILYARPIPSGEFGVWLQERQGRVGRKLAVVVSAQVANGNGGLHAALD